MTKPPAISVVIPTHNRVALVERAIASVLTQTYADFEVVIVNDGSTDGTEAYLETVRTDRCRILTNAKSLGVSAARNRGVAAATGELITFLDDDDALRPDALGLLHERYSTPPRPDFLWGGRLIHEMDAAGNVIGLREDDWRAIAGSVSGPAFLDLMLEIATNSAFTIRRTLFGKLGGFDEALRQSEDRDLFIALAKGGYAGTALNSTIIDVDERFSSLSRNTGRRVGAAFDLQVIAKHQTYLDLPDQREFLNAYLLAVYVGFLEAGDRRAALRILTVLFHRRALRLESGILRKYMRHAPEFRALKAALRYDAMRRLRHALSHRPNP